MICIVRHSEHKADITIKRKERREKEEEEEAEGESEQGKVLLLDTHVVRMLVKHNVDAIFPLSLPVPASSFQEAGKSCAMNVLAVIWDRNSTL